MEDIDLLHELARSEGGVSVAVLLDRGRLKVRRIDLAPGARIPPCQMQEDVLFIVLAGEVTFRGEGEESRVTAPGAVFIPGGAPIRTMEAHEASVVLGVLRRRPAPDEEDQP